MQNSKRIQKILSKLNHLEEVLGYYTNNKGYSADFKEIRGVIEELALDKKIDHVRFAKKLKGLWKAKEEDSES